MDKSFWVFVPFCLVYSCAQPPVSVETVDEQCRNNICDIQYVLKNHIDEDVQVQVYITGTITETGPDFQQPKIIGTEKTLVNLSGQESKIINTTVEFPEQPENIGISLR